MIIKKLGEIPLEDMSGYDNISKQIVLGPKDGSKEIVVRYFSQKPGAKSPYHTHPFPHLVYIVSGQGMLMDSNGNKYVLGAGDHVYINDNEKHCFENIGKKPFDFYCTVPIRGEKM